jgi:hypothetical protein
MVIFLQLENLYNQLVWAKTSKKHLKNRFLDSTLALAKVNIVYYCSFYLVPFVVLSVWFVFFVTFEVFIIRMTLILHSRLIYY